MDKYALLFGELIDVTSPRLENFLIHGSPIASKAPESLGIFALSATIQNSTRARRVDQLLCRSTIPEKLGDKTLFINSDQLLFTPTVPQIESWSYYLLSADKTIHPK